MVLISFNFLSDSVSYKIMYICIAFLSNKIKLSEICNSKTEVLAELELTQITGIGTPFPPSNFIKEKSF